MFLKQQVLHLRTFHLHAQIQVPSANSHSSQPVKIIDDDQKEHWPNNGTLGNSVCHWKRQGVSVAYTKHLLHIPQKLLENLVDDSIYRIGYQLVQKMSMWDAIKCLLMK